MAEKEKKLSETEEKVIEAVLNLANALEAAACDVKQRIAGLIGIKETATVKEEPFTGLEFKPQKGEKLGEFEVANRQQNIPEKFNVALNILRQNNSTISNRYHGSGYQFGYWIYNEIIFRQKLKA